MDKNIIIVDSINEITGNNYISKKLESFIIINLSCDNINYENLQDSIKEKYINYTIAVDERFSKEYSETISSLSSAFKNKLIYYSFDLFNRVQSKSDAVNVFIEYIKFEMVLNDFSDKNIIIITKNYNIIRIILKKYKNKKIECHFSFKMKKKRFSSIIEYIFIIYVFLKSVLYLMIRNSNQNINFNQKKVLIRTIYTQDTLGISSLDNYIDYYFNDIEKYISRKDILFLGDFYKLNFMKVLKLNKKFKKSEFLSDSNFYDIFILLKSFFISIHFKLFFSLKKNNLFFRGIDVYYFIEYYLQRDINSSFYMNLVTYFMFKKIAKKYKNIKIIYAYENRPIEKLMLMSLQRNGINEIYGYFHAPIDERHIAIGISNNEKNIMPLPRKIFVIGKKIKEDLVFNRNFPEEIIEVLGVLKHSFLYKSKKINRKIWSGKILVLLSCEMKKNLLVVLFLKSYEKINLLNVRFRFHPSYFDLELSQIILNSKEVMFNVSRNQNLIDDLYWSDLVIHTNTGSSCEALFLGKPMLHIQTPYGYNDNMLKKCEGLCWSCSKHSEMTSVLEIIEKMTDETFNELYVKSKNYLEDIFEPCKSEVLSQLIDAKI